MSPLESQHLQQCCLPKTEGSSYKRSILKLSHLSLPYGFWFPVERTLKCRDNTSKTCYRIVMHDRSWVLWSSSQVAETTTNPFSIVDTPRRNMHPQYGDWKARNTLIALATRGITSACLLNLKRTTGKSKLTILHRVQHHGLFHQLGIHVCRMDAKQMYMLHLEFHCMVDLLEQWIYVVISRTYYHHPINPIISLHHHDVRIQHEDFRLQQLRGDIQGYNHLSRHTWGYL